MDTYSLQRLARIEHEQMVRSLPTVSEYEPLPQVKQSIWRRTGDFLQTLWNRLALPPRQAKQDEAVTASFGSN